ncbi:MAG: hypothetical protein AAF740_12850 [Bacteroidota bacterium]
MSSILQVQVNYEIAMSIGASLELNSMLKESLTTYLQKLNGRAIAIFEGETEETLYTIPRKRVLKRSPTFAAALEKRPSGEETEIISGFVEEEDSYFYWFPLAEVGQLLLIRAGKPLEFGVQQSLRPINQKLTNAIKACQESMRVQTLGVQVQEQNQKLVASEEELRQNLEELQATQEDMERVLTTTIRQKEAMIASINYAERIQKALFLSPKQFTGIFPNSFLYFRWCIQKYGIFYTPPKLI